MRNDDRSDDRPTLTEMLGQVVDLSSGLGILLLPLLVTSRPGVILFLVLPAVLLIGAVAAPVAVAAVLLAPPYLLVRATRRRLRGPRWAVLVLEPVEHAGGNEPTPRLLRVDDGRELEHDEHVMRILDAAEHALRCGRSRARGRSWSNIGRHVS